MEEKTKSNIMLGLMILIFIMQLFLKPSVEITDNNYAFASEVNDLKREFNNSYNEQLKIINKQFEIIDGYKIATTKVLNQNEDFLKSYEESNEELYSCWNENYKLLTILEVKYNWQGDN